MLQEDAAASWELRHIDGPAPLAIKLYVLFLFITCLVALTKLVRTWIAISPFVRHAVEKQQSALPLLERTAISLRRWIGLALLLFGIFTASTIERFCRISGNLKMTTFCWFTDAIGEWSVGLELALFVVAFLYLIRWSILNRIERFRK